MSVTLAAAVHMSLFILRSDSGRLNKLGSLLAAATKTLMRLCDSCWVIEATSENQINSEEGA
jgi:recombinational DNA repair protein RecR